jgi:hypothetical protein
VETHGQRLLGRLAELSWFTVSGEVAATRSLAMLLEEPVLRTATADLIHACTGVDVSSVRAYFAESVHADLRRPDLEGLDITDWPIVVVEAKFSAVLTVEQIRSYLDDQAARLAGPGDTSPPNEGVMVVLVPAARKQEAAYKVHLVKEERTNAGLGPYPVETTVLSWDQWLDAWDDAVADLPATPDSVAADLVQLRAMCMSLGGLVVAPLGPAATGAEWRAREDALRFLTDQVTRNLAGPGDLLPIGDGTTFLARRYVPAGLTSPDGRAAWAAIGIRSDVADAGGPPIWVRFHKRTPQFARIRDLLLATPLRDGARRDEGHLWLPLTVQPEKAGTELVEDLVAQYRAIQALLDVVNLRRSGAQPS